MGQPPVALPPGTSSQEGRVGPDCVVLPSPAISPQLNLGSRVEPLAIEELVSQLAVVNAVQRGSNDSANGSSTRIPVDVGRCGAVAGLAPVPSGLGDQVRPVLESDDHRHRVDARQLLQHNHRVPGLAAPAHPDGQANAAGLVDEDDQRKAWELLLAGDRSIRGQAPQQRSRIVFFLGHPVGLPSFRWVLSALNSNPSD